MRRTCRGEQGASILRERIAPPRGVSRRSVLRGAGLLGLGLTMRGWVGTADRAPATAPGTRPDPSLPEGTDTLPQIEHVVILMMENHSFDNYFGALDLHHLGFPVHLGAPRAANPDAGGTLVHAFHMPSACQLDGHPSQSWNASHLAYNNGRNDGFVLASGPVAMGYWTEEDIPFSYGLARTFPTASRWFRSTLCQRYPNRRFLMAGTAAGIIDTTVDSLQAPPPSNGNIFERLDAHGITWRNYYSDFPSVAVLLAYAQQNTAKLSLIAQFYTDAAAGTLPAVSLVDPKFVLGESEENPDDIRVGEQFVSQVINAVMAGPGWAKTMLVWLYDEHGGYCDHVRPAAGDRPGRHPAQPAAWRNRASGRGLGQFGPGAHTPPP